MLHIITSLGTGGAQRALHNILSGGLARGGDSAVVSLRDEGTQGAAIRDLGVAVYALGIHDGMPSLRSMKTLRRVVADVQPEVIQGWMYHGNLVASLAARMVSGRRPAIAWNVRHSLYSLGAEKLLSRQVIRVNRWTSAEANAIVYNSWLSREQHEAFGFASGRGQVIPNGFDLAGLQPDAECGQASRRALSIPRDAIVIGHVARFHPMKGHATFLRTVVGIMRQRSDVMCLLAGREVNLKNSALVGIVPPDLEARFRFVGERDDVPNLMRAMDVFCLSSAWGEAFPNVLGEAMALHVPCVATDVGDSRDIVADTGEVVPPSDCDALARGLLTMLNRTPEERAKLGEAARARIEARYALPSVVGQYRGLYERVVSK